MNDSDLNILLNATRYASEKHRHQKRKDGVTPYIHHPIQVAGLMAQTGRIRDIAALAGALLHDTIEDTDATAEELTTYFGENVATIVLEVTDNKKLPYMERKHLQVERASSLSLPAKWIRLADKICNVQDMATLISSDWSVKRKWEYFDWAERVCEGVRGCNAELERAFVETLKNVRQRTTG